MLTRSFLLLDSVSAVMSFFKSPDITLPLKTWKVNTSLRSCLSFINLSRTSFGRREKAWSVGANTVNGPVIYEKQTYKSVVCGGWWFLVLNATFNYISVISWRTILLVEESGVPGEKNQPVPSHWQALSHNVVSSTPRHERGSNSQL